jgi:hypothetical protein
MSTLWLYSDSKERVMGWLYTKCMYITYDYSLSPTFSPQLTFQTNQFQHILSNMIHIAMQVSLVQMQANAMQCNRKRKKRTNQTILEMKCFLFRFGTLLFTTNFTKFSTFQLPLVFPSFSSHLFTTTYIYSTATTTFQQRTNPQK